MKGIIDGLEKKMEDIQGDIVQVKDFLSKETVLLDSPRESEAMATHTDGQCSASHPVDACNHLEDKLEAPAVCLDSKALNWFQWWEARTPVVTWDTFREEIEAELSLIKLGFLTQIMDHSQHIEDKIWALSQAQLPKNQRVALPQPPPTFTMEESNRFENTTSSIMRLTPTKVPPQFQDHKQGEIAASGVRSSTRQGGHYRRLSDAEYHDKLKKGLCFRCDEKYDSNHRCISKQLNLLIGAVENVEEDFIDEGPRDVPKNGTIHLNGQGKLEIIPPTSKC
ncbi:hypothetical protein V6N12_050207 [Hibiscus sabdariffa]|uniref:Retrotransposon protein n=1 Tax=Hibiscus sabdariffa TaxID=183260 RepID=A0ABR2GBR3_9ROSI